MKKPFGSLQAVTSATLGFCFFAPLVTFGLLWMKGLPLFAEGHPEFVLIWLYEATGWQALFAGVLLSAILLLLKPRWGAFVWPYDFGRSLSLGAVAGATAHAVATVIVRGISHRPFSDFWIAGALISGCIAGAIITSLVFWRISKNPIV